MKYRRTPKRVKKFLGRYGIGAGVTRALDDPRDRKGRRWPFHVLVETLLMGATLACPTLKDVERASERCGPRVPDSTLSDLLGRLDPGPLRGVLVGLVRRMARAKALRPRDLPYGVIAIDNKCSWSGDHEGDVDCLRSGSTWLMRWLRAVLTSAPSRPCIDQVVVPKGTNDHGAFPLIWRGLMEEYRRTDLFRLVTLDAGFTFRDDLALIDSDGFGYVAGVKENQPGLLHELVRLFLLHAPPCEATSGWEPSKGGRIRRDLYRLDQAAMKIDGGWPHLRQGWLVRQTTQDHLGDETAVDRYFITNLPRGNLSPAQALRVVRGHWHIENDCNRTLDMVWMEDSRAWASNRKCRPDRAPLRTLAWLRLLAYDFVGWLRCVHLRVRLTWRDLLSLLALVLLPIPSTAFVEVASALGEVPPPA